MELIKIYERDSKEYKKLEQACKLFTAMSPNGSEYKLKNIYFDLGLNWMYTAIVTYCKDGESFQALSPVEYEKILTTDDVMMAVHDIISSPHWTMYCTLRR